MLLTTSPSPIMCAVIRIFIPLSFNIIFTALLVKIIFLIMLNKKHYFNTGYQSVCLLVLVLVQVAVSCYLLISQSPDVVISDSGVFCAASFEERLHGHLYNIIIVSITVLLYLRYHSVR